MNTEHLKLFIDIVDNGSFSKTQEISFLSKQAMYKQINKLEEETKCQLLERTRQGIRPTDAGRHFYQGAKKIIQLEDQLIKECRQYTQTEMIRIGNVEHQVILDPVNNAFSAAYPEIAITRIVHPNHSGEYRVYANIMDVGETFNPLGLKQHKNGYTPLIKTKFHVALRPEHPLAKKEKLTLSDLSAYKTYIFPLMLEKKFIQDIENAFSDHPDNLLKRKDVDNQVNIAFSCIANNYLFLTANPFIKKISDLITIPIDTDFTREYGVIYKEPVSDTVQKYIETAVRTYQNIDDPFYMKINSVN